MYYQNSSVNVLRQYVTRFHAAGGGSCLCVIRPRLPRTDIFQRHIACRRVSTTSRKTLWDNFRVAPSRDFIDFGNISFCRSIAENTSCSLSLFLPLSQSPAFNGVIRERLATRKKGEERYPETTKKEKRQGRKGDQGVVVVVAGKRSLVKVVGG